MTHLGRRRSALLISCYPVKNCAQMISPAASSEKFSVSDDRRSAQQLVAKLLISHQRQNRIGADLGLRHAAQIQNEHPVHPSDNRACRYIRSPRSPLPYSHAVSECHLTGRVLVSAMGTTFTFRAAEAKDRHSAMLSPLSTSIILGCRSPNERPGFRDQQCLQTSPLPRRRSSDSRDLPIPSAITSKRSAEGSTLIVPRWTRHKSSAGTRQIE